jgi:hypothetical protein
LFLLFPNKSAAVILPKRSFASAADIAALRALIRDRVKGKVKLRE